MEYTNTWFKSMSFNTADPPFCFPILLELLTKERNVFKVFRSRNICLFFLLFLWPFQTLLKFDLAYRMFWLLRRHWLHLNLSNNTTINSILIKAKFYKSRKCYSKHKRPDYSYKLSNTVQTVNYHTAVCVCLISCLVWNLCLYCVMSNLPRRNI